MIVVSTVLIVRNDEEGRAPVLAVIEGLVDIEDELLALGDIVVGMLAVAGGGPVRLQKRVGRQRSTGGCGLEVFEEAEMRIVRIAGIGKVWRVSGSVS